jgi:hypothetical protein
MIIIIVTAVETSNLTTSEEFDRKAFGLEFVK